MRVSLIRSIQLGVSALFSTRSSFPNSPSVLASGYYCTRAQQGSASVSALPMGAPGSYSLHSHRSVRRQMTRPETPNQMLPTPSRRMKRLKDEWSEW